MHELQDLLAGRKHDIPLDIAALQLASIEYPALDSEPFLQLLDSHAREFSARISPNLSGDEFIELFNAYLFEELGFRGNSEDYYHPANSCLNEVIASRTGLPITLSIVYMEICRRLSRPVRGVGLPGHFVVEYNDDDLQFFIDPFHNGRVLLEHQCLQLAQEVTGYDMSNNPEILQPVSNRHIIVRMLNNLRAAYLRRHDLNKVITVLNLMIGAIPDSAEEYKQRGLCRAQIQDLEGAREDLGTYLRLQPEAPDRDQVEVHLQRIMAWISGKP